MEYEEAIAQTAGLQKKFSELESVRGDFIRKLTANPRAERLNAQLDVNGADLGASCFGYRVDARPRSVCLPDGNVAIEYAFYSDQRPGTCVWSFVLLEDRSLQFYTAAGFMSMAHRMGIDAPALVETLLLQLHAAVFGTLTVPAGESLGLPR